MNRIKELFENLITFFRKYHPPKAVAEEVPDTELPEEKVEPTYKIGRASCRERVLSFV